MGALSLFGQGTGVHYLPMAPGAMPQVGKWTIANSGANFLITNPDGTTATVAKAAALTQSVTVFALPTNAVVGTCFVKVGTGFVGLTALTATVGVTGALTACLATPLDFTAAGSEITVGLPSAPIARAAGTNLILALTSTIENLSSLSAGSVSIWIAWYRLP